MNLPDYDDEHMLFGMLHVLGNRLQVLGDNFYDEITAKQWLLLVMLEIYGEAYPTLNELSDAMGSSHQNVKQLVVKLESKGYVAMFTDTKDRRKTRILMKDKCQELNQKYNTKQQEFMRKLFKDIDKKELKYAVKTLIQLEKNILSMK
jgi:DNA-binding MarR family transcriptional regulator